MKKLLTGFALVTFLLFFVLFAGYRYQIDKPDIWVVTAVTAGILAALGAAWLLLENKPIVFPGWPFLAYLAAFLAAATLAENQAAAWREVFIVGIGLLLFLGAYNLAIYNGRRLLINSALVVGLLYAILKGIQIVEGLAGYELCQRAVKMPNKTAVFISLAVALALGTYHSQKTNKEQLLNIIVIVLGGLLLMATGSRAALIAFAACMIRVTKTDNIQALLAAAVTFVALGIFLTRPPVCAAAWGENIFSRYDIWGFALRQFINSPLAGIGPGNYALAALPVFQSSSHAAHAHNIYLQVAAERGLIGLAAGATVAGKLIEKENSLLDGVLLLVLIGGLADYPFSEPFVFRYFLVVLAIGLTEVKK